MLVIGAIANDGGEWRTMVVENGSREGRVERDLASASLLLFVCCCLFVVVVVVVCCLLLLVLFLDAEPNRAHNGECTASTVLIRGFNGG